jgi:hypothetical protein
LSYRAAGAVVIGWLGGATAQDMKKDNTGDGRGRKVHVCAPDPTHRKIDAGDFRRCFLG